MNGQWKKDKAEEIFFRLILYPLIISAAGISVALKAAAVAAEAAAAIVASAAPIAAASAAATITAAAAIFLRFSFVDLQHAAIDLFAVELRDCLLAFVLGGHLDKAESARAAGFAVLDYVGRRDRSDLSEESFKILIRCIEGKISYV